MLVALTVFVVLLVTRGKDNTQVTAGSDAARSAHDSSSASASAAGSSPAPSASDVSTSTATSTSTTSTSTTTTIDPAVVAQQKADEDLRAVVLKLDVILTQSSQGRGEVAPLVTGVKACTVSPSEAGTKIDSVVRNRQSVLDQVSALDTFGNPDAVSLVAQLHEAVQASIDADRHYREWMTYLYTDYYYTYPIGCPSGAAPTNAAFDAGQAASGRATAAKAAFVDAYNPIAGRFGVATWAEKDI